MLGLRAPERIETDRLILRRPRLEDADEIFSRYAGDPEVVRYVGWPRHESIAATRAFLQFSDSEWARASAGPYLVESRAEDRLLGASGLVVESDFSAATGYVFARAAWGRGYATETLLAMVEVARQLGLVRLYALCHVDHRPSAHVLEKCDFLREGILRRYARFPNLAGDMPCDVLCYSRILESGNDRQ